VDPLLDRCRGIAKVVRRRQPEHRSETRGWPRVQILGVGLVASRDGCEGITPPPANLSATSSRPGAIVLNRVDDCAV
jgi:hypothetical protein